MYVKRIIFFGIIQALLLLSCRQEPRVIVQAGFIDSLLAQHDTPQIQKNLRADLLFWKQRINPARPGLVSELRYASCLVQQFQLFGDIQDLLAADSLLRKTDSLFNYKEAGPGLALIRNCILRHRFREADSLLQEIKKRDIKPYDAASTGFDVAFERGQYLLAENELRKLADPTDFGYQFRKAKMAHYNGEMDTAVAAMERAVLLAGNNKVLKQAALTNAADLSLHNADPQHAYNLYRRALQENGTDLHAFIGMGWIALLHDGNDSLAERIFRFVQTHTQAPDVLLKLEQVAQFRGNREARQHYAQSFERIVSMPAYGDMYNKYLLEHYTGILDQPAKAAAIAKRELHNRSTPQTWAWYVYALYRNRQEAEAYQLYAVNVAGKPLEALELYWMGRYMEGIGKGYNADQFYKAANRNRYDLGIDMQDTLEQKRK